MGANLEPPPGQFCDSGATLWVSARITAVDGCDASVTARIAERVANPDGTSPDGHGEITEVAVHCTREDVDETPLTGAATSVLSCDRTDPITVNGTTYDYLQPSVQVFRDVTGNVRAYVGASFPLMSCHVLADPT